MAREVNKKMGHVKVPTDFKQEWTDMVMGVNRNGSIEIAAKDMKEGADVAMKRNEDCSSEIPMQTRQETTDIADAAQHVLKDE
jgi:hypothetical protein